MVEKEWEKEGDEGERGRMTETQRKDGEIESESVRGGGREEGTKGGWGRDRG